MPKKKTTDPWVVYQIASGDWWTARSRSVPALAPTAYTGESIAVAIRVQTQCNREEVRARHAREVASAAFARVPAGPIPRPVDRTADRKPHVAPPVAPPRQDLDLGRPVDGAGSNDRFLGQPQGRLTEEQAARFVQIAIESAPILGKVKVYDLRPIWRRPAWWFAAAIVLAGIGAAIVWLAGR